MSLPTELDLDNLPRHIAIIMDGNGRWAQKRKLIRTMGHKVGVESVQVIVRVCRELGIEVLTLYAFSSENWQRPAFEVNTLMTILKTYLEKELNTMVENNIQLRCIGQKDKLPEEVVKILDRVINETSTNTGMILNLALSYGGRDEMVRAIKHIAQECIDGSLSLDAINHDTVSQHLYTADLPDPDLLIRTGGESRLSNFLLWQASYAEIYITDVHWPDFRERELYQSIVDYQLRQRRFGKTGEQVK